MRTHSTQNLLRSYIWECGCTYCEKSYWLRCVSQNAVKFMNVLLGLGYIDEETVSLRYTSITPPYKAYHTSHHYLTSHTRPSRPQFPFNNLYYIIDFGPELDIHSVDKLPFSGSTRRQTRGRQSETYNLKKTMTWRRAKEVHVSDGQFRRSEKCLHVWTE